MKCISLKYAISVSVTCSYMLSLGSAFAQGMDDRSVSRGLRSSSAIIEMAPSPNMPAISAGTPYSGDLSIEAESLAAAGAQSVGEAASPDPLHPDVIAAMEASPETIIGWDSRMRFSTRLYPNRAIVYIQYNGGHLCTGFMISSNTVATSGHCLHTGGSNGQWRNRSLFRVFPGRDGTVSPFGSCGVTRMNSVGGWTVNGLATHDYGAIRLDCTVGNTVGWFGLYSPSGTELAQTPVNVLGYSGDKAQQQWGASDKVRRNESKMFCYRADTVGGNSGGPAFHDRNEALATNGTWAIGVHGYGIGANVCGGAQNQFNGAVRVDTAVLNNYIRWIAAR